MMTEPISGVEANATAKLEALPRRLDAYLAAAGITDGVATIDGAPAGGARLVYPGEEVKVDGATIAHKERQSRVHAYHKLNGEKIEDIRPAGCAGLSHVGQLDKKTTGLLLFTDDSELSRLILCPGLLEKTYVVEIDAPRVSDGLTAEQLVALTEKRPLPQNATERRKGRNERNQPVGFESVVCKGSRPIGDATRPPGCAPKSRFAYEVIVRSGANHVVKRLFDRVGRSVRTLHRAAIGPVRCDVAAGASRALTADEVSALWTAVGGDGARAALRRASLLCCARSNNDERLRALFSVAELHAPGGCYGAFPGLSCVHYEEQLSGIRKAEAAGLSPQAPKRVAREPEAGGWREKASAMPEDHLKYTLEAWGNDTEGMRKDELLEKYIREKKDRIRFLLDVSTVTEPPPPRPVEVDDDDSLAAHPPWEGLHDYMRGVD